MRENVERETYAGCKVIDRHDRPRIYVDDGTSLVQVECKTCGKVYLEGGKLPCKQVRV